MSGNDYFVTAALKTNLIRLVLSEMLLAMELGCGGSLLSLLSENQVLPESRVRPILMQVFSAVAFAHEHQIVHRDIKLENVVFKDFSQTSVLLIDWGLSTNFSSSSLLHEDCGSLHYASPELLASQPYVGPEIDSWALGVLMYTLLVGNFPYPGSTPLDKLQSMTSKPYITTSLCPTSVALIAKLLDVSVSTRITPAEALADDWFLQTLTPLEFAAPQ